MLDDLSARYAINHLFAADDHPLREYTGHTPRTLQQSWLDMGTIQRTRTRYPTLHQLFSLVTRFLKSGEVLENTHIAGPLSTPAFKVTTFGLEESNEGPDRLPGFLQQLASRNSSSEYRWLKVRKGTLWIGLADLPSTWSPN